MANTAVRLATAKQTLAKVDAILSNAIADLERTQPGGVAAEELALALLDASDDQGWDRLTWADGDEYTASYGYDDEGNEFDPIPPTSAVDFAKVLLSKFEITRKP